MSTVVEVAAEAFGATLAQRGALAGATEDEARERGERAALLVGSATRWREHLGELLVLPEVMELLGVGTRQAVYDLVRRQRLLGLPRRSGAMVFPAFQFDAATSRPYPVVTDVLAAFADADLDTYTTATWLATGQDELAGASPTSLLTDPGAAARITAAARRAAARLSH